MIGAAVQGGVDRADDVVDRVIGSEGVNVCAIAVMAKASSPGRTKTRLVPPLTPEEAAQLNTAFLQDVAANLSLADTLARIAPFMAFGPPGTAPFFRENLPAGIGLIETWFASFGECLFHAVSSLLARDYEAACLLNSDSPTLPTALLAQAAAILAPPGDRLVLGPSNDGGYYLIGMKQPHARLFEDVDWSTERVAAQTIERAVELGLPVHVLPVWYDVDDIEGLRGLSGELFEGHRFDAKLTPYAAPNSAALLRSLMAGPDFERRLATAPSAVGGRPLRACADNARSEPDLIR